GGGDGHGERTSGAEGKAAGGLVELHRGDAKVEHDAVHRVVAAALGDRLQVGESDFHQGEPAARRLHEVGGALDRVVIAIDGDDVAIRRGENRAAGAAGAEGAVDGGAAGA